MTDAFGLPGGPAFPISIPGVGDNGCPGMSLRDYFAARAIPTAAIEVDGGRGHQFINDLARIAYEIADAMLAERGRK